MTTSTRRIGLRRSRCWWEPMYSGPAEVALSIYDWNFETATGARGALLDAEHMSTQCSPGYVYKIADAVFDKCDFQGIFTHTPSILFDKCRFVGCDFAFSTWLRVTFRNCEFQRCSISLTTFTECEFRDCIWERIGFSGNRTLLERSFITNPSLLIAAGYSGVDPQRAGEREHAAYQRYRLEGTKARRRT